LKRKGGSEIAKKNSKRNEAKKKIFFSFAKTSENETKQDAFRLNSLRSENLKSEKGTRYCQIVPLLEDFQTT
jgi:hypothetical protein